MPLFVTLLDFRDVDEDLVLSLGLGLSDGAKPKVLRRFKGGEFKDTQSSNTRLRLPPASTGELLGGGEVRGEGGCWRGRDAYVRRTVECEYMEVLVKDAIEI